VTAWKPITCSSIPGRSPQCERLSNEREVELEIAAAEQAKITELRLKKLVN